MEVQGIPFPGPVLAARSLTVRFGGITALEEVSIEIASGEVLGIIGPNGAGKTTLFNAISGFVPAQSGELEWKGLPLAKLRTDRLIGLGIARTLQGVGLFPGLTVLENVIDRALRRRLGDRTDRRFGDHAVDDRTACSPEQRGVGPLDLI
jgi:branched-chain amino acid transport system ATP-binding protein